MTYDVAVVQVAEQRILSIRRRVEGLTVPQFIGHAFGELYGGLPVLGVTPAGPPFVIYHEFGPRGIDAEVCVPVPRSVESSGTIRTRDLPPMTAIRTLHVGPYDQLGEAYRSLEAWLEREGVEAAGPFRERYLVGPGETSSPADYRTEVELPIVSAPAAIPV